MNEKSLGVFNDLKPFCIALSAVSLQRPNESLPQLQNLLRALSCIDPALVSQNIANYVFFPLKPLFGPDSTESIRTAVFDVLSWLFRTAWLSSSTEVACQLVILITTSLARAKSEELKTSLFKAAAALFKAAGSSTSSLEVRPTLAHFTTLALDEAASIQTKLVALNALNELYANLDGDTAASFLPGTVSTIVRALVKVNQKSSLTVCCIHILQTAISQCLDGQESVYRTSQWAKATQAQLIVALSPVMSHLITLEHHGIEIACLGFCEAILQQNQLAPTIFVEYLLQADVDRIPSNCMGTVGEIAELYINALARILSGADERRKVSMIRTLKRALTVLSNTTQEILSELIITQIRAFVTFTKGSTSIALLHEDTLAPAEPSIEYISDGVRDELCGLLETCVVPRVMPMNSAESFWLAEKTGYATYAHALEHLAKETSLSVCSIVREAHRQGIAFRGELMHVLYPLLALDRPSLYALNELSIACQYSSMEVMIIENADYIINSLDLAFVTLDFRPNTPRILGILVQLAPPMVELIDDVVETYFRVLDNYHGYAPLVEGIFTGLSGVIRAVSKQEPRSAFQAAIDSSTEPVESDKSLEERFAEVKDDEASARMVDDERPDLDTKGYKTALKIVEKAQIFLSHADDNVKQKVLELIYECIPTIATNENKYLPLIHLYWPQLVRRLEDRNAFVVAFVLRVIARTVTFGGSFMRMRIKDDIIPFVKEVLSPQRDKRGNLIRSKREWEGTGRRKVAEEIQAVLTSVVADGGLRGIERKEVLAIVEELSSRSVNMKRVLEQARGLDEAEHDIN